MNNTISIFKTIKSFNKKLEIEGDKSLSIRWSLLASQAIGKSTAQNILMSEDVLSTLKIEDDIKPGYYGFPILLEPNDKISRNQLCLALEKLDIETRPNMGGCLPDQPGFLNKNHRIYGSLKNARSIRDNAFFIGVHSVLTNEDFSYFENALKQIFESL